MSELWQLYLAFLRIGGLTFGGGMTMLPMLKYEVVEKRKWLTEDELLDCYAIGQCTPGIISVNTATFVGYKKKGVLGGLMGTLGMITPSLVIITVIAIFLQQYMSNQIVAHALVGIRVAVCALMLNTVVMLARRNIADIPCAVICVLAFILALFTEVPTIIVVMAAGFAGFCLKKVKEYKK